MKAQWKFFELWAPLKTVLFRDGGVSRVLTSSCIRPYTPVFRARLPCTHKKCLVFRGAISFHDLPNPLNVNSPSPVVMWALCQGCWLLVKSRRSYLAFRIS